ncbi:GFA family protein [Sphingomonas sp. AOB5]|uniref:GFA family protein n=1 Tax=Sphingomonas sp. AOB5 TaxID=3034017 RepID=UPI0023F9A8FF|nr:GFA family protein [Sphingomonas sp. AOB5]MDF7774124.1 GFA family protein [Sphingomonas sp. AOB5]
MASKTATCRCGAVSVTCEGEPVRVSVCHCLNCQRRSGSAFAAQARFPVERVKTSGETRVWTISGDSGGRSFHHFCPECGSTGWFVNEPYPETIAVPLGNFAEPGCYTPTFSVYESRKHPWVEITGDGVEHD